MDVRLVTQEIQEEGTDFSFPLIGVSAWDCEIKYITIEKPSFASSTKKDLEYPQEQTRLPRFWKLPPFLNLYISTVQGEKKR